MIRGSHHTPLLRRLLLAGTLAAVGALTAGCEVGTSAPMLQYHELGNGAYTTSDGMKVINAFVLGAPSGSSLPAGGSASVFLALFNGTYSGDTLESVTAPGTATSVQLVGGPVSIPAQQAVYLTGPQPKVILRHLTSTLRSGGTITMDFQFQRAGTVPATVPVEAQINDYTTYSPPPSGRAATGKAHGGKAGHRSSRTAAPTVSGSPTPSPGAAGTSPSPSATSTR